MLIMNPFHGGEISLETIKHIERESMPRNIQILQRVNNWDDVVELFGLKETKDLIVISDGKRWFALVFRGRYNSRLALLAELAKIPGSKSVNWNYIWDVLREEGFDQVYSNFREHTSYKSFKRQEDDFIKRGIVLSNERVLADWEMVDLDTERIYEVFINI